MELQEKLERLKKALVEIAKLDPKAYTPDQEHWEWGNYDDSYAYGADTAYRHTGTIAKDALKDTEF